MSVQELRAESMRRGLGTARARADLIQRLTDHDATEQQTATPPEAPVGDSQASAIAAPPGPASTSTGPRTFRREFEAEPDGPDEETHLAYRQATVQAAIEAGHTPRGDARLASTVDGRWVYEVSVRQVN